MFSLINNRFEISSLKWQFPVTSEYKAAWMQTLLPACNSVAAKAVAKDFKFLLDHALSSVRCSTRNAASALISTSFIFWWQVKQAL